LFHATGALSGFFAEAPEKVGADAAFDGSAGVLDRKSVV
jgi:hypothetical protein